MPNEQVRGEEEKLQRGLPNEPTLKQEILVLISGLSCQLLLWSCMEKTPSELKEKSLNRTFLAYKTFPLGLFIAFPRGLRVDFEMWASLLWSRAAMVRKMKHIPNMAVRGNAST